MRTLFLLLALVSLAFPSYISAGSSTQSQAGGRFAKSGPVTRKNLAKVAERWAGYWSAKQLDELVALYAEDAVFLTGQGDRFTGKKAIRDIFEKALKTNSSNITVRSLRTEIDDTLAYDSGDYHEVGTAAGADKRELSGSYIIVFRKQNGRWLIIEHAWTDKPAKS
jgi:uncharacterized protein (TIGR02246 family)